MGCNCTKTPLCLERSPNDIRRYYKIGKLLGSGSFGQVRDCTCRESGKSFAVKIVERKSKEKRVGRPLNEQMVRTEVDILSNADHPHIVRFYNCFEDKHFFYVVLEECSGGELFYQIVRRRNFTEADAALLCKQVLSALDYLHTMGVIHRDIKAENFMFKSKAHDSPIKLIDFGMSARIEDGGALSDLCGSPHYISPEIIRKNYNSLADIWAFGVMVYLMLFGRYPFEGTKPADIAREIVSKDLDWQSADALHLTAESKDFLGKLLERDPSKRMTAAIALSHPWIAGENPSMASSVISKDRIEQARRRSIQADRSHLDIKTERRVTQTLARAQMDYVLSRTLWRRETEPLPSCISMERKKKAVKSRSTGLECVSGGDAMIKPLLGSDKKEAEIIKGNDKKETEMFKGNENSLNQSNAVAKEKVCGSGHCRGEDENAVNSGSDSTNCCTSTNANSGCDDSCGATASSVEHT